VAASKASSVSVYKTARRYIPEDNSGTLLSHRLINTNHNSWW
jgi:hypothetical protein